MTADEFAKEHWKVYETYTERKERVIEIATSLYLGFVSALLLNSNLWSEHRISVSVLAMGTTVLVWFFVSAQMRLRTTAAWMCNSCQSLMTLWLGQAQPSACDLSPVDAPPGFAKVKLPKVLVEELRRRKEEHLSKGLCKRIAEASFERIVYGLLVLWTGALVLRFASEWCHIG